MHDSRIFGGYIDIIESALIAPWCDDDQADLIRLLNDIFVTKFTTLKEWRDYLIRKESILEEMEYCQFRKSYDALFVNHSRCEM